MLWRKTKTSAGRVVYQYVEDKEDSFAVMGVVDYDPARPRYKASIARIGVDDKWFDSLEDAKQWVEGVFVSIKLGEI